MHSLCQLKVVKGKITFDHVRFSYDAFKTTVLKDLTFEVGNISEISAPYCEGPGGKGDFKQQGGLREGGMQRVGDGVCEEKLLGAVATCVQTWICCRKCASHTSDFPLLCLFVCKRSQQEKRLPLWARVARVKAPSLASFSASTICVIRNAAAFASTVRE